MHSCNPLTNHHLAKNQVALITSQGYAVQLSVVCSDLQNCSIDPKRPVATITENNQTLIPQGTKFYLDLNDITSYEDCYNWAKELSGFSGGFTHSETNECKVYEILFRAFGGTDIDGILSSSKQFFYLGIPDLPFLSINKDSEYKSRGYILKSLTIGNFNIKDLLFMNSHS